MRRKKERERGSDSRRKKRNELVCKISGAEYEEVPCPAMAGRRENTGGGGDYGFTQDPFVK